MIGVSKERDVLSNNIVEFGNNKNCRIPMRKTAITEVEKPETAVVEEKTEKKK